MSLITEFKNKTVDFDSMLTISEYINQLLADDYNPVLILSIQGVLFDYCNEDTIIDLPLKGIIKRLINRRSSNVLFLTDRPVQYLPMTNKQLNCLNLLDLDEEFNFNIFTTDQYSDGNPNIPLTIQNILHNNRELLFDPKSIVLFINFNDNDFKSIKSILINLYTNYSLFNYLRKYISIYSYIPRILSDRFFNVTRYVVKDEDESNQKTEKDKFILIKIEG